MKFVITTTTPDSQINRYEVENIKEAKSVAMHITKAKMVSVQYFDGIHIVQINTFPGLGCNTWKVASCTFDELNRNKNKKFLARFLKSAYAKSGVGVLPSKT